jgi:lysophospholipase L1-like esterase
MSAMKITECAIGSQGVTHNRIGGYSSNTGEIRKSILQLTGDEPIDLVILEVGANDQTAYSQYPGTHTDLFTGNADTATPGEDGFTFCGCLNACLKHLQANTDA